MKMTIQWNQNARYVRMDNELLGQTCVSSMCCMRYLQLLVLSVQQAVFSFRAARNVPLGKAVPN